eukprot:Skav235590  [mRNA]  locus=scaffold163:119665:119922:+ [translate_table: standard]
MPSMSKLSVAVGTGLAATAFVAPSAGPTGPSTSSRSLRGDARGSSNLGLTAAGLSISGLAAMALSRPVAKMQTQVVRNAYDASKE